MALAFRTTQMRQLNRDQRALLPRRNPARAVRCQALRRCSDAVAPKPSSTSSPAAEAPEAASLAPSRRQLLAVPAAAAAALSLGFWRPASASAEAAGITIDADEPGVGEAAARAGDLVLIHYTGARLARGSTILIPARQPARIRVPWRRGARVCGSGGRLGLHAAAPRERTAANRGPRRAPRTYARCAPLPVLPGTIADTGVVFDSTLGLGLVSAAR